MGRSDSEQPRRASDLLRVPVVLLVCALAAGVVFGLGAAELEGSRSAVGIRPRVLDDGVLSVAEIERLDADLASTPAPSSTITDRCADRLDDLNRHAERVASGATSPLVEVPLSRDSPVVCQLFMPSRSPAAGLAVLLAAVTAGVVPLLGLVGATILRDLEARTAFRRRAVIEAALIMTVVVGLAVELGGQYRFDLQNLAVYVFYFAGLLPAVSILRLAAIWDGLPLGAETKLNEAIRVSTTLLSIAFSLAVALIAAANARFVSEHGELDLAVAGATFGGFTTSDLALINAIESVVFVVVLAVLIATATFGSQRRARATPGQSASLVALSDRWPPPPPHANQAPARHPVEAMLALLAPLLVGALSQLLGIG